MAYLTIRIKGSEGYERSSLDKDRIVLGRSPSCELPIRHSSISREHCVLVRQGDDWVVEDLESANGTRVNKDKIAARTTLKERDIIAIGQARLTFHAGSIAEPEIAIDIKLDDEAGIVPAGPSRVRKPDEPLEATACTSCGTWLSIAHHIAGDRMRCPRCKHDVTVPALSG